MTASQKTLLYLSEAVAITCLKASGTLRTFAMTMQRSGEVETYISTPDVDKVGQAIDEIYTMFSSRTDVDPIAASVLVTTVAASLDGDRYLVFDIEQIGGDRMLALLPYAIGAHGPEFQRMTFHPMSFANVRSLLSAQVDL